MLLSLRDLRITTATLSASQSCVGHYNAEGLSLDQGCLPNPTTPAFVTGGRVEGFVALDQADKVFVAAAAQSLCVLLSGDPTAYGDGQAGNVHCKRDADGKIVMKGDWCAATDAAATSTCADAFRFRADFAASGIKINN